MVALWKTVLLAVVLCLVGAAQSTPPKTGVEGRVTDNTGIPLSHASIVLEGSSRTPANPLPPAYRTASSADGAFAFDDVEPNTYRIFVQRTGYLDFVYIQPDGKVAFPLRERERFKVEIKLTAPSFLSGRVTNEDGEPFADAQVKVLALRRLGNRKQLHALPAFHAGPDGSFSSARLAAGRYYLSASSPPSLGDTNQREISRGKTGGVRFVTTYYPSSIDTSGATVIDLPKETELRNLDIRVRRARVFHIAGKIGQPPGITVPSPTITLIRPGVTDMSDQQRGADRVFAIDGTFQVNGLVPGEYVFQTTIGSNRQLQGHLSVILADRDLDDVVLNLVPALEIPLSVKIDDADEQLARKIASSLGRFTLTSTDGLNSNAMAAAKGDGTWIFHSIGLGTYRMGLGGPEGTYVKSVRFGDQDVTHRELDTTAGGGALAMVLSPHAAAVSGTVNDADGKPLAGVTVSLWLPGLPAAGTIDEARSTATDAAGAYRFENLHPGDYRIAAWEKVEPGLPNLSEFHVKFDADATSVSLKEDSREKVQPVVIGRQKVEAIASTLQ